MGKGILLQNIDASSVRLSNVCCLDGSLTDCRICNEATIKSIIGRAHKTLRKKKKKKHLLAERP